MAVMSENKGKGIALLLSIFLLAAGFGTILYPTLHGLWMDYVIHRDAEAFLSYVDLDQTSPEQDVSDVIIRQPESVAPEPPAEHTQLWLDMKAYNEAIFEAGQEGLANQSAYEQPSFTLADYGLESEVFGVIAIPRLEIEMPLYLGASKQNMANGAAIMGQTSLPIGGSNTNCVIAGHRGWNGAAYFLYINQLEKGDTVTITNLWETLTYEVVDTEIIYPSNVEAIHIQPDRELLTLLTCHPPASGGKQRYLVFCERVTTEKEDS